MKSQKNLSVSAECDAHLSCIAELLVSFFFVERWKPTKFNYGTVPNVHAHVM